MDLGITAIGIITIAACVLPFVAMGRKRKKFTNSLLESLNNLASEHQSKLSEYEFGNDLVLGIDHDTNHFFFYKQNNWIEVAKTINLAKVKHCSSVVKNQTVKTNAEAYRFIEKLEMKFSFKDSNGQDVLLEFYSNEVNMQLNNELQLLEKWVKLINQRL